MLCGYMLRALGIACEYRYGVGVVGGEGRGPLLRGSRPDFRAPARGGEGGIGQDGFSEADSPYALGNETLLTPGMEPEMRGASHSESLVKEAWVLEKHAGR